ncbi:MAG TPA: pyridoxal-phosphate dependent enzyme [Chitinophagaceae bacterium]|nr:pyridoxal-phosphate dependent enzyme [Chitinophagaceae bacterium]
MQHTLHFDNIITQPLYAVWLPQGITLDVLRLDALHDVVSGNKWFKLKYYLAAAQQSGCNTVATFGGAYSNHIIATAFACKAAGLKSIGIIRGERPAILSHTLQQALACGMQLHFVTRQAFKNKQAVKQQFLNVYWVNEGGHGAEGARGAAEILAFAGQPASFTNIVCAVGTGTMFAGLVNSAEASQTITGVSVLKNNFSIHDEISALLIPRTNLPQWQIVHDYHFGGYAKHPAALIQFMQEVWQTCKLPTDIVYTAKTLYAIRGLIQQGAIMPGSRVLMIHSGGLQGNMSLAAGVLPF